RRKRARVAIAERRRRGFAAHPARNQFSDILPLLFGGGREPGQWFAVRPGDEGGGAADKNLGGTRGRENGGGFDTAPPCRPEGGAIPQRARPPRRRTK